MLSSASRNWRWCISAPSRPCRASRWSCRRGKSSAFSAPTAPAKPRCCVPSRVFMASMMPASPTAPSHSRGCASITASRTALRAPGSPWYRSARRRFPNLTVGENLMVPVGPRASAAERRRWEDKVVAFFPQLGELRFRLAGLLSGGELQMLAIASALVCRPELLLIDELSLGLSPVVVDDLMVRLVEIKRDLGITVVLVEQSAAVALEVVDYAYVLRSEEHTSE